MELCSVLLSPSSNIGNKWVNEYFYQFYFHKICKFNYKTPEWMNTFIISSLKKRSKLAKIYYSNPTQYNKEGVTNQAGKCTQLILEAKEQKITKISAKLDDPKRLKNILVHLN